MKPKPFEELLAGATPGEWKTLPEECHRSYIRVRGTRLGARYKICNVHAPDYKDAPEHEAEQSRANATYIARCSPAVMREVWEALKCVNENIIEKENAPFICAMFTAAEAVLLRRALAALNGEKPENKED